MDRNYIEAHHVVARYLADQLSDPDREAFESFCRANPQMFREIEAAARFKVGLAKLDETKQLQAIVDGAPKAARPAAFRVAAVVAGLVVGGAVIYGAVVSLRVPVMGATVAEVSGKFRDALPVVARYDLLTMRTTEPADPKIILPQQSGIIVIRTLIEGDTADSYRVVLRRVVAERESVVANAVGLTPDDQQWIATFVRTDSVEPGHYELSVGPESTSSDRGQTTFRFETVKQP
jgi:hypothetical protein